MAEPSDQSGLQRRATWVGLRTLRQRPKIVGETRSGEPVFEIRSVRLVLRDDASHFNRLAECSKCGREVPGAPILTTADLDRPAHPVICKDCVRASGASRPLKPEKRPEPPPPPAPAGEADGPGAADAGEAPGAADARMQDALREGLAEIRAELLASSEGVSARLAALEEPVRRRDEDPAQAAVGQRGEADTLAAALDEIRAEVQRLAASSRETAQAQVDLDRRLAESAALADPVRTQWPTMVQAVRDLVRAREHVQGGVDALLAQAKDAEARVNALASAVGDVANRVRALELRVQESADRVTASGEGRPPAGRAPDEGVAHTSTGPPDAGELLDGLERQLREAEGRLSRLSATGGDGA